jgi:hypothetical protein
MHQELTTLLDKANRPALTVSRECDEKCMKAQAPKKAKIDDPLVK